MKSMRRIVSMVLCLVMVLGLLPVSAFAAEEKVTYVLAGSDFQHPDGHSAGAEKLSAILNTIYGLGYTHMDGFLFGGDYDFDTHNNKSETETGLNKVQDTVQAVYGTEMDEVYVQGNHDYATSLLSPSGNNDTEDYGVYVIHEDDYMDTNSDESTIAAAGEELKAYLDDKVAEGYDKPIFVISHLPLHYSSRTARNGDAMYAHYLFDPLNAAGTAGLNIIYMHGHDHAYGYDNYLGGHSIYLPQGDTISIAVKGSRSSFTQETLSFTYMNYGYTGYYSDTSTTLDDVSELTMTVFEITEDDVVVRRFNSSGECGLKAAGIKNGVYDNMTPASHVANTKTYSSPQIIAVPVTLTHKDTGVSVTAIGLTDLEVTTPEVTIPQGYSAYVSYDITPEGYTQGTPATVTIPLDETVFDLSRPLLLIDKEKNTVTTKTAVDGTITFTTEHFSEYDIAQLDLSGWTEISDIPASYRYTRDTNGIDYGEDNKYLIVARNAAYALASNGSGTTVVPVTLSGNNNNTAIVDSRDYEWYFATGLTNTNSSTYNTFITQDGRTWLYHTDSNMYVGNNNDSHRGYWRVGNNNNNGYYSFRDSDNNSDWYLYYGNSKFTVQTSSSNSTVRLYKYDSVASYKTVYARVQGSDTYTVNLGASSTAALNAVKLGITGYTATDLNGSNQAFLDDDALTWTWLDTYNGTQAGSYTLQISYYGVSLGTVEVVVEAKLIDDDPDYPNPGSIQLDKTATGLDFQNTGLARVELSTSGLPAPAGVDIVVVVDTSSSMNSNKIGDKTRLQVLQEAMESMIDDFNTPDSYGTMPDMEVAIMDFNGYGTEYANLIGSLPEWDNTDYGKVYTGDEAFGDAGSFVDAAQLLNFNVANEINEYHSGTNYDDALRRAYELLEAKAAANEANGEERDQYVIFLSDGAPFGWNGIVESDKSGNNNGGYTNGASYYWWNLYLQGTYADLADMDEAAERSNTHEASINTQYQFLNNANGTTHPHRWAEAIKGDPNDDYTVFSTEHVAGTRAEETDLYTVKGLGATIYSIGFGLAEDYRGDGNQRGTVTVETMTELLETIASENQAGDDYYWACSDADQLANAFNQIVNGIRLAATNAYFVDEMGEQYDLQLNPNITNANDSEQTVNNSITVSTSSVYTRNQVGTNVGGHVVTADDVGKTYGDPTVEETVTFTADAAGNITATSSELSGNILIDGVICAKNFFYNTTAETKTITLASGSTYALPGETFYWNIGTINEKKFTLSYVVYLTGSMEGTCPEGDSYETNGDAILFYTNYLGNDVSKRVDSPSMPWGGANVSYAFYLVDTNGNPLLADGTRAENFLTAYKVTAPVLYKTINLNSGETVLSTIADDVLPEGYDLYDDRAVYTVNVSSSSSGSSWSIEGDYPASTYVMGYAGANDYSNKTPVSNDSYDYTHTTVYFAVVWTIGALPDTVVIDFGLSVDISVLENDMFGSGGKLVAIGEAADKPASSTAALDTDFGTADVLGAYGVLSLNRDTETGLYKDVRYTPGSMVMNSYDQFAYAVQYTGSSNAGFYYGDVTVIPATTIYYEDSFVDLTTYNNPVTGENGTKTYTEVSGWPTDSVDPTGTQDEDRPGEFSLDSMDADNLYGTDSAYASMSTYSMGKAAKINVTANQYGTAEFTFYGTGFDVISMTDNTTGTIVVQVKNEAGEVVKSTSVNTYYGYEYSPCACTATYTENGWVYSFVEISEEQMPDTIPALELPEDPELGDKVTFYKYKWLTTASNDPNALYQVPVIKMDLENYAKYTVTITVTYFSVFDDTTAEGYDFYLDAIRIYNPAGDTSADIDDVIEDAYNQDGELFPEYYELRNMIIGEATFDSMADEDNIEGIVFIDSNSSLGIGTSEIGSAIEDYTNFGPNNELYLAPGQAVTFLLNASTTVPEGYELASVQIAMKSAGGTAYAKIWNAKSATVNSVSARTIATATDMYYDITSLEDQNVVIMNSATEGSVILSITNIKVTYKQTDSATSPAEVAEVSETNGGEDSDASVAAAEAPYVFSVTKSSANIALLSMAPMAEEDEPTEPETEPTEPETEPTEPETEPTEPETEPTEPETEPTEPETEPTEPENKPTEPENKPSTGGSTIGGIIGKVIGRIIGKLIGWLRG